MKVIVVAEQLRRDVPGGIGTYIRGLLGGLERLGRPEPPGNPSGAAALTVGTDAVPTDAVPTDAVGTDAVGMASDPPAPDVALWASRSSRRGPDPLAAFGSLRVSRISSRCLTRAWDHGLVRAPPGFDVIHATSLLTPPTRAVHGSTTPMTVFVHDLAWRTLPDGVPARSRRWHDGALARVRRRATRILVPSASTADALGRSGFDTASITVVAEGCDHLPLHRRHDGGYLLSVSTLEPRKNLDRLIEAYVAARTPLPLKIVGPRGWTDRRGRPVLAGSPPTGVELVGYVDDDTVAGLLAGARALVYVPLLEGWGLPAVEAMRAGCPVVASPMPSIADAALVVDPTSIASIAAGIRQVVSDDATAAELAGLGIRRASGLTWSGAARHHVAIWEDCR